MSNLHERAPESRGREGTIQAIVLNNNMVYKLKMKVNHEEPEATDPTGDLARRQGL
jgi:hypothetical protein